MKIDKSKLPLGIWHEDESGNIIPFNDGAELPKEAASRHVSFPLEVIDKSESEG